MNRHVHALTAATALALATGFGTVSGIRAQAQDEPPDDTNTSTNEDTGSDTDTETSQQVDPAAETSAQADPAAGLDQLQQQSFTAFFERCGVDPGGFDGRMVETHWTVLLGLGMTAEQIHAAAMALDVDCGFVSFRSAILASLRSGHEDGQDEGDDQEDSRDEYKPGKKHGGDERRMQPRPKGPGRR